MTMEKRGQVTLGDGVVLDTWVRRANSGRAVILLHGDTPADALLPLVGLIGDEVSTYRYVRRGDVRPFDRSGRSIARAVSDLEELADLWGVPEIVVVCHSSGTALALAHAAAHPDRVAAIGQFGGLGGGVRPADGGAGGVAALSEDRAGAARGAGPEEPVPDADLAGWAVATRCPVYFVHGTADSASAARAVMLAARAPQARKRVVVGGGNRPWVEQPAAVGELLAEIVRAGRPGPASNH